MEKNKLSKESPSSENMDNIVDYMEDAIEEKVHHKVKWFIRQKGTFTQRSGFKLANRVMIFIGVIVIGLLCVWQFGDATFDQTIRLFEIMVLNAFLPVFTLILGYIFGSQEEKQSNLN